MFKTIDTSGDGFVSFDEMVAAARKSAMSTAAKRGRRVVGRRDLRAHADDFATS